MQQLSTGDDLIIDFDCTQATYSLPQWAATDGQEVVAFDRTGEAGWTITVRKGATATVHAPAPGRRAPRAPRRAPRADGDQNCGVVRYTVPPRSRNSRDFSAMPSWAIRSWEAASP